MKISDYLGIEARDILRLPNKIGRFTIYPVTVAQMVRLNPILAKFATEDLDSLEQDVKSASLSKLISYYDKYGQDMLEIAEILVGKTQAKKATADEVLQIFISAMWRIGGDSFLKSIDFTRKSSLSARGELIASQRMLDSMISQS